METTAIASLQYHTQREKEIAVTRLRIGHTMLSPVLTAAKIPSSPWNTFLYALNSLSMPYPTLTPVSLTSSPTSTSAGFLHHI